MRTTIKASEDGEPLAHPEEDRLALATAQWERENPTLDLALFQMASALTMLGQAIEVEFRALAQRIDEDLGPAELRILLMLRRSGYPYAQRPVDLIRNLLVTSGAITKQIARLEAKELIVRRRVAGRRGWHVSLTERGGAYAMQAMRPGSLPLFSDALHSFTSDEQVVAVRFLRRLIGRIDRRRAAQGEAGSPADA